jgi:hypothetical protein
MFVRNSRRRLFSKRSYYLTMRKKHFPIRHLFAALILFIAQKSFSQHALQVDDGLGHYSIITGANPGGNYSLPPGGGMLLTSGSSLIWYTDGNTLSGIDGTNNVLGSLAGSSLLPVNIDVNGVRVMRYDAAAIVNIIGGRRGMS